MDLDGLLAQVRHTNRGRVRSDVASLLRRFGSLTCRLGKHTANDGTEARLLAVEGTLPIAYKGNPYNIPVELLVPAGYPAAAPLCFVRPVQGMEVQLKIYQEAYLLHLWRGTRTVVIHRARSYCETYKGVHQGDSPWGTLL